MIYFHLLNLRCAQSATLSYKIIRSSNLISRWRNEGIRLIGCRADGEGGGGEGAEGPGGGRRHHGRRGRRGRRHRRGASRGRARKTVSDMTSTKLWMTWDTPKDANLRYEYFFSFCKNLSIFQPRCGDPHRGRRGGGGRVRPCGHIALLLAVLPLSGEWVSESGRSAYQAWPP